MEQELSSEVGAAGRLFSGCIDIYWALIHRILTLKYKRQPKRALRTEFGRFYFWGDGFYPYEGRLDEILANSSRLRNRVLSILVEIGEILCNDRTGLFALVNQDLDDERLRDQRQEVRALIEGIRETLDDMVSSGSESDTGSDISDQGSLLQKIIYNLRARIQCLVDLTGSLERPAADADLDDVETAQVAAYQVSGPAEIWTRKALDTFPKIDSTLAQRLGEANWQRYQRLSKKLEQAEAFEEVDEGESEDDSSDAGSERDEIGKLPDFTTGTKSSVDPSSIFSSIGRRSGTTGTSISAPHFDYAFPRARRPRIVGDLRSQVTYTSVISNDQGERGWLQIPSMPKGASEGKVFRCTVCGDRQKDIISWTEWKRHVFSDLEPYICLYADCKGQLTSYSTRKAWADHEFSIHRKDKAWVCNDCAASFTDKGDMREHAYSSHGNVLMQNQLEVLVNAAEISIGVTKNTECPFCSETPGVKSRAFAMHVGKHMEEVALAVLPRDSKFEEDRGSTSSDYIALSDDLAENDEKVPETKKRGLKKGLPPGWVMERTASGRTFSTDRAGNFFWGDTPSLSNDRWELEFCHAVVVELLKIENALIKANFHTELHRVQENLIQRNYSSAQEFYQAILDLEQRISIPTSDILDIFHRSFMDEWSRMSDWLRINRGDGWQDSTLRPDIGSKVFGSPTGRSYSNIYQFMLIAVIGKGAYAKILLARSKSTQELFAIKAYRKHRVIEDDQSKDVRTEKNIYIRASTHPFIAKLISTFQTDTRLYFVLEYVPGGDLMRHIQKGKFDLPRTRFYAAEVCLVLQFLHRNGIIYRYLKLENILLNRDGHIKIVNFGQSKDGMGEHAATKSFVGTPDFMAPEILLDKMYNFSVDWWAFGVLLYQMVFQQSPFRGDDEDEIYDAILADEPLYPEHQSPSAEDLMRKLLKKEPQERLGYVNGPEEIRNHVFFESIDWEALLRKEVQPPFLPTVKSYDDLSNFDEEFTKQSPALTPVQSALTPAMQAEFKDFSLSTI